jgi:septal ring-binding cell division protein DamX
MVSAILVLLMGAVWFFRDRLPLDLLGGSQVSQGSGTPAAAAANLGEEKSPEVEYSAAASPEPVHELPTTEPPSRTELASVGLPPSPAAGDSRIEENRAHMRQKLAELQSWRDAGRSVYTVHLHSFQEMSHAREFADELWQSEDWDQPLFVEKTGTDPVWYRVLAGGFRNSREARDWITEFKKTQGAVYAQATRLEQGAQVLLPVDGEAELARQGVDG